LSVLLLVISRTPVVTTLTQTEINDVLTKYKLDKDALTTLDITSCPRALLKSKNGLLAGLLKLVTGLLGGVLGLLG